MNERLIIEGNLIDLPPGGIRRNIQINDVAEAKDRQASYSNSFVAPLTPRNVKAMDFLGVTANGSLKPYRRLKAEYYFRGIPLVTNGYVIVKKTGAGYSMAIYDGIIDLAERIKGKKLSDLDFSDLNHYLSTQKYIESLSNTEGYIYALADFGYNFYSTIKVEDQAPSVFFSTIWDKIFQEAGLGYVGGFFQTNEDFKTEVLAPAKGYDVNQVAETVTDLGTAETEHIRVFEKSNTFISREEQFQLDSENIANVSSDLDGTLTVGYTGNLKLDLDVDFRVGAESYVTFRVYLNNSAVVFIQLYPNQTSATKSVNLNVETGDKIVFKVVGSSSGYMGQEETIEGQYFLDFQAQAGIQASKTDGGQFIDFAKFVPEMEQSQFIKDVMQRYGLILKPVRNAEAYEFIQFEELLNGRNEAEDWTGKLSSLGEEDYSIDYAKVNSAEYKYPKEAAEFPFNGTLEIDNENAPAKKALFSSPFEIAYSYKNFKGWPVYTVPIWEEQEDDGTPFRANIQTPAKIFRIRRVQDSANVKLFDEANTTPTSEIVYLGLENIEMQYFINNYYKAYKAMVERAKKREALLNLSLIDVYELNFFRLKFLKQSGSFYYLNKLISEPEKLSKAELVQIDQFSTNEAPSVLGTYTINTYYGASRTLNLSAFTTLTVPVWFDPEYDQAAAVKITGGFNPDILLKDSAGNLITQETEFLVEDLPLTVEDAGNTTSPHSATFTFKVKDAGSGTYSSVEGQIVVNVAEYVNQPPIADPGENQTVYLEDPETANALPAYASLDGSGSYDGTGAIVSYTWTILNGPLNHTASIYDADTTTPTAGLRIPSDSNNLGSYDIQLTVEDEFGATDSAVVSISVVLDLKTTP